LSDAQIALLREWVNLGAPKNSGSKVMLAKETSTDVGQMYVAAEIVDGPPPMPEVPLPLFVENPPRIPARAIATNPRSPLMAVAGYRQVMLYNLEDNSLIGALPFEEGEIETLTFSVNGELLVAGGGAPGKSGCAVVWQVRSGERLGKYDEGYDTVLAVDISPDHRLLAVGGPNKTVSVYSTANGERVYKIEDHTDWIYSVKFTPDGEVLATADRAGGLFLWQAANGRAVEQLRGHNGAIHDLAYSKDSVQLASAGADGTVRLWHTWDYKQIRSFNAHGGGVFSVDFNAANELVTTGQDKTIKRWDNNGKELLNYGALPDWGYQARFGLNGEKVVAGGWTGEVGVWNTAAAERVATLATTTLEAQPTQVAAAK
jgi:WD40 repeat protein